MIFLEIYEDFYHWVTGLFITKKEKRTKVISYDLHIKKVSLLTSICKINSNHSLLHFQLWFSKAAGSRSKAFFSSQFSKFTEDLVPSSFFCIKFLPLYINSLLLSTDQFPYFCTFHFQRVTSAKFKYS